MQHGADIEPKAGPLGISALPKLKQKYARGARTLLGEMPAGANFKEKKIGSPGRTRTADRVVNSHLLYLLSYRGMEYDF